MDVAPLTPGRLPDVVDLIRRRQADPRTHVAYLSTGSDAIAVELTELEPDGLDGVLVALAADGAVAGVIGAEHDVEPPRVWWFGPYAGDGVDELEVADLLMDEARERLPGHVVEEELAGDDRNRLLAAVADRHGFVPEERSALLSRRLHGTVPSPDAPPPVELRRPSERDRRAAAALHDASFPGTHSTGGSALRDEPDRVAVVAVRGSELVGYVVAEIEADGHGYLDYVAVPDAARGLGIGHALVAEVCRELRDQHDCPRAYLSVRVSNRAARRLYEVLGFEEERLLRPWRRGFSLEEQR